MTGQAQDFPPTRVSLLEAVRTGHATRRQTALEGLSRAYWHPLHAYVRLRWRLDDDTAQDLVQEFFAQAIERDLFARYDPSRARLRTVAGR
ncbi:MAG TPA: hypothetical protein VF178_11090 [Gemmatimonadaceae bacterium]